jgi:hypothetical protein
MFEVKTMNGSSVIAKDRSRHSDAYTASIRPSDRGSPIRFGYIWFIA